MGEVVTLRGTPDPLLVRARLPMNDIGNARRFAALAAGRLLFCAEIGRSGAWLWFDGARWSAHDGDARARSVALAVADGIGDEARALMAADMADVQALFGPKFSSEQRDERAAALWAWALKSGNADRTAGMLKQAQALEDDDGAFVMRASLDQFDTDVLAYNCLNGVIRFSQVEGGWVCLFTPGHRPEDMMMQLAGVAYDPAATAPLWRARLAELHDDPVARLAIQRIYGMTLTGLTSDQAFYIFQGQGNDGKSMTNDVMAVMHGDYFRAAGPQTFLQTKQRGGSEHQSDIVRLRGDVRLVVTDEPPKGSVWNGERIKQVTGSKIVARAPNAVEEITFVPRWQLIVECNPLPRAPSDDRGFRRRFKLFPWVKSYGVTPGLTDEAADVVKARLTGELSGILNWAIEGALGWLQDRDIPEPELARLATSNFWASGSALVEWIEARCDTSDKSALTEAGELYASFRDYCLNVRGDKDDAIMNQTNFGRAMNERHFYALDKTNAAGRKVRQGIRIKGDGDAGTMGQPTLDPSLDREGSNWRPFAGDDSDWDVFGE